MKEYQAVIVRLQERSREDEETLTDLLNERSRMGWDYHSSQQLGSGKVLMVFCRQA
ncbi:MAG: hypothetical protein GTN62_03985 [Gemmatimonadales bacterium]|nr:hypothetical protein [Gemmatimonadales bacterium]NIN10468.1 hypothetical protein [Gemmatimonadales bacterium]NIN49260.1 hypothetical protein [Gemmatimonadales bacterium]NIP06724.1 hypothetical protein [Gemmatimonadales bacterium]NIR00055.1 hypothetical protein [Gemmatimonadales bacterium]